MAEMPKYLKWEKEKEIFCTPIGFFGLQHHTKRKRLDETCMKRSSSYPACLTTAPNNQNSKTKAATEVTATTAEATAAVIVGPQTYHNEDSNNKCRPFTTTTCRNNRNINNHNEV